MTFEIERVPCETCGEPTRMTGTKRCDGCYEVECRLSGYLRTKNGRRNVVAAMGDEALAQAEVAPATTVYLVATGHYSDYSIRAAFSTREKAETYSRNLNYGSYTPDDPRVEEWPIDDPADEALGMVVVFERGFDHGDARIATVVHAKQPHTEWGLVVEEKTRGGHRYSIPVRATTEDRAIRIACDLLAQWRALQGVTRP